jgi:hypothetical protein
VPVAHELWDGAGTSVSVDAFAPDIAATQGDLMNNNPSLDPRKALADIQALARVALEGALQPPDPK